MRRALLCLLVCGSVWAGLGVNVASEVPMDDGLLGGVGRASSPVAQTGQSRCWDQHGSVIDCTGTGQDGEYQYGVSVDPRFTRNSNGTVTDNLTGLIWLRDANCLGPRNWTTALTESNGLGAPLCGLSDGSLAGDWRLPNVRELHSLIDYGEFDPALPPGHPFSGVQSSCFYWVSTSVPYAPAYAWDVNLDNGQLYHGSKLSTDCVWPVRGGSNTSSLANVSTRGQVGSGADVLIAGFIVDGTGDIDVLIRALGPTLAEPPFNLGGVLSDPLLQVFDGSGTLIDTCDNWQTCTGAGQISAGLQPPDILEPGVVLNLAPGNYTAIVSGVGGITGVGLVEVYDHAAFGGARASQ